MAMIQRNSQCRRFNGPAVLAMVTALCTAGCSDSPPPAQQQQVQQPAPQNTKLKVAYLGLTCEAPIFVAQEQGFFKEEGLDVELVKTEWDGLREGLGLGRFDA